MAERAFGEPDWYIALDGSKVGRYIGTSRASYAVTATNEEGEVQLALSGAVHAALAALGSSVVIDAAYVCGTVLALCPVLVCCKALSCCAFMGSSAHAHCAALAFGTVLALYSLSRKW